MDTPNDQEQKDIDLSSMIEELGRMEALSRKNNKIRDDVITVLQNQVTADGTLNIIEMPATKIAAFAQCVNSMATLLKDNEASSESVLKAKKTIYTTKTTDELTATLENAAHNVVAFMRQIGMKHINHTGMPGADVDSVQSELDKACEANGVEPPSEGELEK
jgi:hypothetical protein